MAELTLPPGNAVVQASAGTGKTHNLVALCIQLLGREPPVPPALLWAVTFTEKAAAELKGRIRARVDALAAGDAKWERIRRDLGLAQVGTIHSLCGQILRRHAAAAGVDPRFEVLDEQQSRRLLLEACETTALRALEGEGGTQPRESARRLCAEMGLRAQGKFAAGLAEEMAGLLQKLAETGTSPLQIVPDPRAAEEDDARARRSLERAFDDLRAALARSGREAPPSPERLLRTCPPGQLAAAWRELRASSPQPLRAQGADKEPIVAARDAFAAALDADAGVRGAALALDLAQLAGRASRRHRELKARRGALDFDDLTRLCRDLLANDPRALFAERERLGALLVDEFQDTSAAQIEIFELLSADRPALIVGDRKQSIYDFRGADVAGAQRYAQRLLDRGATRYVLAESRRSRPALVALANALFARALSASGEPFDTPFSADDELTASRPPGPDGPCAELLDVAGAGVEAEAEMVARRIAALVAPGAPERVFDRDGTARPVRGGDVAVLLRRFTNLEAFRRALLRLRVPHLVYKGRGFHSAREVVDLVALLAATVDPDDRLALATVLRSPFGPLSDDALVLLAQRRWSLDEEGLRPDDAEALRKIRALLQTLRREADRLGPASLLEAALAETDYVACCAAGLYGEQAAANVEKLVALARARELRGIGVRALLAELRQLSAEEAPEAEAAVVEDGDPHAVRLLTVHAAKGLEFPVVFVPECASPSVNGVADRVLLDREAGFFFKARGPDGKRRWGPRGAAASGRRRARELAQSRRLLYVAVTRARDLLVLSGRAAKKEESWRQFIDQVAPSCIERGLLRIVREVGAPSSAIRGGPAVDPAGPLDAAAGAAHPDVERVVAAAPRAGVMLSAPVTQLADAVACPRRYQLLHELGLEERPDPEHPLPEPLGTDSSPATALGRLVHRLLELSSLQIDGAARRDELEQILRLEGEDPGAHAEVIDAACAFLDSPLARRMAGAPPGRLHRELPFVLRLSRPPGPELLLRGQIDALLLDEDVTVVDYKLSQARDTGRYAAQLDAYALAARELVGESPLPVRTGIVFLRTKSAPFVERPPAPPDAVRAQLLEAAQAIADGRRTGRWPTVPVDRCREIGCGFVRRCHGPDA